MQEQTEQTDDGVRFTADVRCGQNIRRRGEDIRQDAVVFPAGTRLTTAELPVLASLGIADAQVVRKVRVALFSTGDELQLPGQPLEAGQIYDTNRLTIHLMLQQLGCEVINLGIIPDDPGKLRAAFIDADSQADVVISSGGVSVGEADYTKTILEELGEIAFWKLAIKPGKPLPSANSVIAGSVACRGIQSLRRSLFINWFSPYWRSLAAIRQALYRRASVYAQHLV